MIRFFGRNWLTNNQLFGIFGNAHNSTSAPPPVNTASNIFLPIAINVYAFNHIRPAATGAGNSFDVGFWQNTEQGSFTFDNSDGTSKTTTYAPFSLAAAADASNSEAILGWQVLTGAASAAGHSALVYQQATTNGLSVHAAGDAASNLGVGAVTEYVGVNSGGLGGTTSETAAQCVWPSTGTLGNWAVMYRSAVGTTFNCEIHINAVKQHEFALAGAATNTLVTNSTTVSVTADDLLSIGFTRTGGGDQLLNGLVVFTFQET